MAAETSMTESRSKSLAAESEDRGLWGGRRLGGGINTPPSPPSSSMCSSKPAGREKRGEAQADGWDRLRRGEATGVTEEETAGCGELEGSPAGSSREPKELGYRKEKHKQDERRRTEIHQDYRIRCEASSFCPFAAFVP